MNDIATLAPIAAATSIATTSTPSRPLIGQHWPEQGGILGAILPGPVVDGVQQPDIAVIVPTGPEAEFIDVCYGTYGTKIDGADSHTDGTANTLAMIAAGSVLAQRVAATQIAGFGDWILPAIGQLRVLSATVPHLFDKDSWYVSSTQFSAHDAWMQDFDDGGSGWGGKGDGCRARPVRLVQLQNFGL